ncbi:hypothetical protein [Streptomyces sp. NPDC005423]|uniref:hypothetical protein n=1 Tax=Streptomyces sp. NPDC005423 TaxID=3155343 RepID=UPI0033AC6A3B
MVWRSEEFGESHEGSVGAVLADGSEPKPVRPDADDGTAAPETREWWAYDGLTRRPKAVACRAACACGWRGESRPVDWERVADGHLDGPDAALAHDDWWEHIRAVERRTVPLPDDLADLLVRLEEQLTVFAERAPVAALKAVAVLERLTGHVGRDAALAAQADDLSWETIGRALGISPDRARSRLTRYLLPG